jgi:ACR3 family arsenite efflux pump ArsB
MTPPSLLPGLVSAWPSVAASPAIESVFFYVGTNFYFGPVNKKAPLRWEGRGFFRKRFMHAA